MSEERARPRRILVFGAHPDDCDGSAGGTAALWVRAGHRVRFVSLTNGSTGHAERGRQVRYAEAFEACEYGAPLDEPRLRQLFPFYD